MVPKGRLELPRAKGHYALNVARLPIPPLRPIFLACFAAPIAGNLPSKSQLLTRLDGSQASRSIAQCSSIEQA